MTLELFFVAGSFVVGVSKMAEAWILIREQGRPIASVAATSTIEFAWAVFCVYLLVTGRLEFARWLAIMYLAYIPVEIAVGFRADPDVHTRTPDTFRVPGSVAWLGGVFGGAYAAAALLFLAA
ncbi:MAG: hypothetical protein ACSLFE_11870 [Gemmatimonadaceae bacterium]